MILALHRLRRDEEGQTLVLAAVFGLILALCVLGTVNVGRAAYDKMQLQTAADGAAYSQAAVGARVMNFTAYTNRAMVVHYASIMALSAYQAYFHFLWAAAKPALQLAGLFPPLAGPMQAIIKFLGVLLNVVDGVVAVMTPLICAANLLLYGFQEGAWFSFAARLVNLPPEAHSGDLPGKQYKSLGGLWNGLLALGNTFSWAQVRGYALAGNPLQLMGQNTFDSFKIIYNAKDDNVQMARMHMVEVANSARQPWVAYGDKANSLSLLPGPRHWWLGASWVGLGAVARTELGSFDPKNGGFVGSILKGSGQVWSGNRLEIDAAKKLPWPCGFTEVKFSLFSLAMMDRFFPLPRPNDNGYALGYQPTSKGICGGILKGLLNLFFGGLLGTVGTAMQTSATATFKQMPGLFKQRLFWISPYVSFSPRANATPGPTPAGAPGNFNQPDFIVGMNKSATDYNSDLGASNVFGRKFQVKIGGGLNTGVTDFRMTNTATIPTLPSGITAFAAAQVYYHRPGDWKEMPNLFNPLWGARLMPVLESNVAAKIGLANNAIFKQFILH